MTRRATPFRMSRRSVLRGTAGAALALPWLEVMAPRTAKAQAAGGPAPRALFIYFPTGYKAGGWVTRPMGTYPDITLPAIATALTPLKDQLTMITGCGNQPASVGNGGDGIHARATGTFLTCEVLQKTGFAIGVSADQVIARAIGMNTCVPSIAMGIPGERLPGFDEDGYGEVYLDNVSFTGPRSQVQKDNNPVALFNRLNACAAVAGGGGGSMPDPLAMERIRFETGVMGAVKEEATRLLGCVGREDKIRLDQYYTSVTELEQRFRTMPPMSGGGGGGCVKPAMPPASGANYTASIHLMMDLLIFAFQCGLTRVATMMMDGAFSRRNYGLTDINGADYIHGLSHGEIGGKGVDHPRWVKITTLFYENFAYLLTKMKETSEGERSLLGNSIVYINSEFGDGDGHNQYNLPCIVAGAAGGKYKVGQHLAMADRTPIANVILTIMNTMGVAMPKFGNSTGTISGLLA